MTGRNRVLLVEDRGTFGRRYNFVIGELDPTGARLVALAGPGDITLHEEDPDKLEARELEPTFSLHRDTVQHLFDRLWEIGFRPAAPLKVEDTVAAKDAHLADMRGVVTNLFDVVKALAVPGPTNVAEMIIGKPPTKIGG